MTLPEQRRKEIPDGEIQSSADLTGSFIHNTVDNWHEENKLSGLGIELSVRCNRQQKWFLLCKIVFSLSIGIIRTLFI